MLEVLPVLESALVVFLRLFVIWPLTSCLAACLWLVVGTPELTAVKDIQNNYKISYLSWRINNKGLEILNMLYFNLN